MEAMLASLQEILKLSSVQIAAFTADFNQPIGLKMNLENRWVKKAATIPWDAIEDKYANRLSGPSLGRPKRNALVDSRIMTKLDVTTRCSFW